MPGSWASPPTPWTKRDLGLGARFELADGVAVYGDVHRLAAGGVGDPQRVARGHNQRPRRQRVWRDVADHEPLDPPGEDRPVVGEVVAGRAHRRRRDQAVAADVAHLLVAEAVAELGDATVREAAEGDVVEAGRGASPPASTWIPGSSSTSRSPAKARRNPSSACSPSTAARKPDRAEVDAEDRDPGAGVGAQPVEDRAVAAEDQAEVRALRQRIAHLDARPPRHRAWPPPRRRRRAASRAFRGLGGGDARSRRRPWPGWVGVIRTAVFALSFTAPPRRSPPPGRRSRSPRRRSGGTSRGCPSGRAGPRRRRR